ncbi:hypothetical protein A3K71_05015 [archaeon RBG_16_50_20]|nr:MAG: hypothetical protein A3K71_05015 [archaeon RBG_16_50_20]
MEHSTGREKKDISGRIQSRVKSVMEIFRKLRQDYNMDVDKNTAMSKSYRSGNEHFVIVNSMPGKFGRLM